MFRRKLVALSHIDAQNFDVNDEIQFRNTVVWLEDQHVRHYKLNDRNNLRNTKDSSWNKAYEKYLDDLECPIKNKNRDEELEWLLTFSVSLLFEDNGGKYNAATTSHSETTPKVTSENPLDNLDFQSADFVQGVNKLASLLQIDQQPDHLLTLKAVAKLVSSRLCQKAIQEPNSAVISKGPVFPFEDADSGFALGDPLLNKAAKVLRLLYINDLRQLQTRINECIVAVQTTTANPKTDTKLGQVGR